MPSNQNPLGALPRLFRRPRVLVVGCGDIGMRVVAAARGRVRWIAVTSSPERVSVLREAGIAPLLGDLDRATSLRRLDGIATHVVHLAPPQTHGDEDLRTLALMHSLMRRSPPATFVYASTSGVYGDCGGQWVVETRTPAPHNARAKRRLDAEQIVRHLGRAAATRVSVLRVPGIYAQDRSNGTPRERLLNGTPVLRAEDDVYTNHIHANDLARAVLRALWRGKPQRAYNINDNTVMRMGDYMDAAADLMGLPRPKRVTRAEATLRLSPMQMSFWSESRRMDNTRMLRELRLVLRYPTVLEGLS